MHGPRFTAPLSGCSFGGARRRVGDQSVSEGRIVFSESTNFAETSYLATPREP
jgi:hypothetical protein